MSLVLEFIEQFVVYIITNLYLAAIRKLDVSKENCILSYNKERLNVL